MYIHVEGDPELAYNWEIVFEVSADGIEEEKLYQLERQWTPRAVPGVSGDARSRVLPVAEAFLMDPRKFLTLAQQLVVQAGEEDWRSAVSRAYYSAFHVVRVFMEGLGFTVPQADRAHGYLWLRLQNCGAPSMEQQGRDLQNLRHHRNLAD